MSLPHRRSHLTFDAMDERTYSDEEVARILDAATDPGYGGSGREEAFADHADAAPQGPEARPGGLTLADLREIGAEAGIDPARITQAARSLDLFSAGSEVQRGLLGIPWQLRRNVPLPGPLQDEDWNRTVVLLRERFGGPGEISVDGSLRSWSEKDVSVFHEPDPTGPGWRLRLELEAKEAKEGFEAAGLLAPTGVILVLVSLFTDAPELLAWIGIVTMVVAALLCGGIAGAFVPRWQRARERELEAFAGDMTRLAARLELGPGATDQE